jgi:hypothetical protein
VLVADEQQPAGSTFVEPAIEHVGRGGGLESVDVQHQRRDRAHVPNLKRSLNASPAAHRRHHRTGPDITGGAENGWGARGRLRAREKIPNPRITKPAPTVICQIEVNLGPASFPTEALGRLTLGSLGR